MAVNTSKYIFQLMNAISFFDSSTQQLSFRVEDIQDATFTNEEEVVWATGLNGARISSAARNKYSRITATNGAIVEGVLAKQVGKDISTAAYTMSNFLEEITVATADQVTITHAPQGSAGSEIEGCYILNNDGSIGASYTQAASAATGKFTYAAKVLTLPAGAAAVGTKVLVQYSVSLTTPKVIENTSDHFSATGRVVADIWARDICTGKDYPGKIIFPLARMNGNFELTFGGDPSTQSLEFEAIQSCGDKKLWDFVIFDDSDIAAS